MPLPRLSLLSSLLLLPGGSAFDPLDYFDTYEAIFNTYTAALTPAKTALESNVSSAGCAYSYALLGWLVFTNPNFAFRQAPFGDKFNATKFEALVADADADWTLAEKILSQADAAFVAYEDAPVVMTLAVVFNTYHEQPCAISSPFPDPDTDFPCKYTSGDDVDQCIDDIMTALRQAQVSLHQKKNEMGLARGPYLAARAAYQASRDDDAFTGYRATRDAYARAFKNYEPAFVGYTQRVREAIDAVNDQRLTLNPGAAQIPEPYPEFSTAATCGAGDPGTESSSPHESSDPAEESDETPLSSEESDGEESSRESSEF